MCAFRSHSRSLPWGVTSADHVIKTTERPVARLVLNLCRPALWPWLLDALAWQSRASLDGLPCKGTSIWRRCAVCVSFCVCNRNVVRVSRRNGWIRRTKQATRLACSIACCVHHTVCRFHPELKATPPCAQLALPGVHGVACAAVLPVATCVARTLGPESPASPPGTLSSPRPWTRQLSEPWWQLRAPLCRKLP